jgi:lysophospholipase L1-like esterase
VTAPPDPEIPPPDATSVPAPGRFVRALSIVSPGVRHVATHIGGHARAWAARNAEALRSPAFLDGAPLWVALGDSTAQGIGADSIDDGYVGRVGSELAAGGHPFVLVNLSVSGARVADVVGKQLEACRALSRPPALVTCSVGSNDLVRTANGARVARDVRGLVDALGSYPTAVVATVPHGAPSVAGRLVNRAIRERAGQRGVRVADVQARWPDRARGSWRSQLAPDRFHPSALGYEAWADAFLAALPSSSTRLRVWPPLADE